MKKVACILSSILLFTMAGCGDDNDNTELAETCKTSVCKNIISCRNQGYDDNDLQTSTAFSSMTNCAEWCDYGIENHPDDAPYKIECASKTTSCEALDNVCDVY